MFTLFNSRITDPAGVSLENEKIKGYLNIQVKSGEPIGKLQAYISARKFYI